MAIAINCPTLIIIPMAKASGFSFEQMNNIPNKKGWTSLILPSL
jgi:hypothetical protein